jgi:hypothetical protein
LAGATDFGLAALVALPTALPFTVLTGFFAIVSEIVNGISHHPGFVGCESRKFFCEPIT